MDKLPKPQIKGKDVSLDKALAHISKTLRQAHHPLFSGLAGDVNVARAVVRLARASRGTLDHINTPRLGNTRVAQTFGWVACTLSEAALRPDVFVVVGKESLSINPRFVERILARRSPKDAQHKSPHLIFLGSYKESDIPDLLKPYSKEIIPIADESLFEAIRYLNTLDHHPPKDIDDHNGHTTLDDKQDKSTKQTGGTLSNDELSALRHLYETLLNAQYGCVAFYAGVFGEQHTDMGALSLARFVKSLNRTTRCASLALGNNLGDYTMQSVAVWLTGKPACSSFSGTKTGEVEHNPAVFNTANMLAQKRADTLFWIAPLAPLAPPKSNLPTIVIAHPNTPLKKTPEVFIPTGIPGIDYDAHLFRLDSSAALRLDKIRDSELPNAAHLLEQVREQYEAGAKK